MLHYRTQNSLLLPKQLLFLSRENWSVCVLLCFVDPILGKSRSQCHSLKVTADRDKIEFRLFNS